MNLSNRSSWTPFKQKIVRLWSYDVGPDIRFGYFKKEISLLLLPKNARVVDAGSGWGRYAFYLSQRSPEWNILGIDSDQKRIVWCHRILKNCPFSNLSFIVGNLTIPIEKNSYDFIYCVDVLEHIPNDNVVLGNLSRALAPGGSLLIHVPSKQQKHFFIQISKFRETTHVREGYVRGELLDKIKTTGLEVISTKFTFGYWGELAWKIGMICSSLHLTRLMLKPLLKPFVILLSYLELHSYNCQGNGILLVARKTVPEIRKVK